MSEQLERWRPVPGYAGFYSVSDLGHVRIEVDRHNIRAGTHLRATPDPDGYLYVMLSRSGQQRLGLPQDKRPWRVALLVLAAFVGPCPPAHESNHKNGVRTDNRLANLEYLTKPQNVQHSINVLGSTRQGVKNPAAKLTDEQVVALRERAARGEPYPSLGRAFGVTSVMAGRIARGQAWVHVGGPRTLSRPKGRRARV